MFRPLAVACAALLPILSPASAAPDAATPASRRLTIWADMTIDQRGEPTRVSFPQGERMAPELRAALGPLLSDSRFEPVRVDGVAVDVQTPVRVLLEVRQDAQGASIAVVEAEPSPRPITIRLPEFPDVARNNSWDGELALRCEVGPEGRCGEIEVITENAPNAMVRSARAALREWRWDMPRRDGEAFAVEVQVPFAFRMVEPGSPGYESHLTASHAAHWMRYVGQRELPRAAHMPPASR